MRAARTAVCETNMRDGTGMRYAHWQAGSRFLPALPCHDQAGDGRRQRFKWKRRTAPRCELLLAGVNNRPALLASDTCAAAADTPLLCTRIPVRPITSSPVQPSPSSFFSSLVRRHRRHIFPPHIPSRTLCPFRSTDVLTPGHTHTYVRPGHASTAGCVHSVLQHYGTHTHAVLIRSCRPAHQLFPKAKFKCSAKVGEIRAET